MPTYGLGDRACDECGASYSKTCTTCVATGVESDATTGATDSGGIDPITGISTFGSRRCWKSLSLKYQFLLQRIGGQPSTKISSSSFGNSLISCGSISGRRSSL